MVGGGPAGLSAALFTAKNGFDTVVFTNRQLTRICTELESLPARYCQSDNK